MLRHKIVRFLLLVVGLVLGILPTPPFAADEKPMVEWRFRQLEPLCPNCDALVGLKSTKCQKCQTAFVWAEPTFDNTPDGAVAKFRYALKYKDESKLKESVAQGKVDEALNLYKEESKAKGFIDAIPLKSQLSKDETTAKIYLFRSWQMTAVKEDNTWKIQPTLEKRNTKKMAAQEKDAMGSLRNFTAVQETWKRSNYDRNAYEDYWTYDISCFYRMKDAAGNLLKMIDIQLARADASPAADDTFGAGYIEPLANIGKPAPKDGYWFRVLTTDDSGNFYNLNLVPATGKVQAANTYKWAICAFPAEYGITGVQTFILNEEGVVYSKDLGLPPEIRARKKKDTVLSPAEEKKVKELIVQLGAEEFEVREKAQESLIKIGKPAKALLEVAQDSKDPEVKIRLAHILKDSAFQNKPQIPGGIEQWPARNPTSKGWEEPE